MHHYILKQHFFGYFYSTIEKYDMKNSLNIPSIDANSLGNSLFECITIDADNINKPQAGKEQPMLIQAGIICICLRGEASFVINGTTYAFRKGDMLTLLPNTILLGGTSSDDFMGYAIGANTKFMMGIQMTDVVKSYVNISNNPVISLNGEQIQTVIELCEMLKQKRAKKEHPFNHEISRNLLAVLCYEIHSFYQLQVPDNTTPNSRQDALCQEFLMLVEKHATEHREIPFYAEKLCISPKYLSIVIKKASGRSPVEWVNRTVMLYAKTLLTTSDMTIQQISARLNFPNPSFFGQYFKRYEGITPKAFRNRSRK